jgi:hypothetical protein
MPIVNFIGIADVTACDMEIFKNLKKERGIALCFEGILKMDSH